MFGSWRLLLTLEVAAFHLLPINLIGMYAVFSFFVLSGYLMTAIMQRTYGYSAGGFGLFALNRALRIYPTYWFAVLVALLALLAMPVDASARLGDKLYMPTDGLSWVQNLTLGFVGWQPANIAPKFIPQAWALTVELFYYALIGLGLSRTKLRSWLWFAAGLAYYAAIYVFDAGEQWGYSALPAASLAFSIGALTWHYRDRLTLHWRPIPTVLVLALIRYAIWFLAVVLFARVTMDWRLHISGNVLSALLSALIVAQLATLDMRKGIRKADAVAGDFSYPVYLLHWSGGILALWLFYGGADMRILSPAGIGAFLVSLVVIGILSAAAIYGVEKPVARYRAHVRNRAAARLPGGEALSARVP